MNLGDFSISVAVKDLAASRKFYETLGFEAFDGSHISGGMPPDMGWCMLRNGAAKVGLFMGMFSENVITFNPPDVRAIQRKLEAARVPLIEKAKGESGPAHITFKDPDGNSILIDQHSP